LSITGELNIMANYKKWTSSELDYIQNNHTLLCDESLAASLSKMTGTNISTSMVRRQRRKLSLKKNRGRPKKYVPVDAGSTV
jgi:hypothetical protein